MTSESSSSLHPDLEFLQPHLQASRGMLAAREPADWPLLDDFLDSLASMPTGPTGVLPLASCAAAGGDPADAVALTASWRVLNHATNILDDVYDRDRPGQLHETLGAARTFNLCGALLAYALGLAGQARLPDAVRLDLQHELVSGALRMAAGEDRDVSGDVGSIQDYWEVMGGINGAAFAMVCAAGGICAGASPEVVESLRTYGHHLGIVLQLFDDLEGTWEHPDHGDLDRGRMTLPVLWALTRPHEDRDEARAIVDAGPVRGGPDRLREILARCGATAFTLRCAMAEHDAALSSLEGCPGQLGVAVLRAYVTSLFADTEEIHRDHATPARVLAPEPG